MRRGLLMALLVLVVGSGVILRGRDTFQPWKGSHKAWGGAMYGNIAHNLLQYDLAETKFAPLTNTGPPVSRDEFEYYYHYPPLLVSMVAVSYRVFGIHEGSARAVPLAFSLLTMALVFAFAYRFWSLTVAVAALVIVAFLPVEIYYADHVDVYGPPSVFFSMLAVFGYALWYQTRRRKYLVLTLGAVVLGCLTAWYAYFVAGLLAAHALFVAPRARRPSIWVPAGLILSAVAVFSAFLIHRHILIGSGGSEVMGTLLEKLLIRAGWTDLAIYTDDGWVSASPWRFAAHIGGQLVLMLGIPALLLGAAWAGRVLTRARSGIEDRDWFLLILLGFGLLHSLAFPMLLPGHDFLVRAFAPGVAIAAAITLVWLMDALSSRWGPRAGTATLAAGLAFTTLVGFDMSRDMRNQSANARQLAEWGTYVRGATTPETVLLLPQSQDRVFQYYLGRRVHWEITSPASLHDALEPGRAYVFAVRERDVGRLSEGLEAALSASGEHSRWNGLRLYPLGDDVADEVAGR